MSYGVGMFNELELCKDKWVCITFNVGENTYHWEGRVTKLDQHYKILHMEYTPAEARRMSAKSGRLDLNVAVVWGIDALYDVELDDIGKDTEVLGRSVCPHCGKSIDVIGRYKQDKAVECQ